MPLLEDGSEKGLKGHFKEDFSHRARVGMGGTDDRDNGADAKRPRPSRK